MSRAFTHLVDLASERFGAAVVAASDDFFAPKQNLIRQGPPQWIEGRYTDRGKWMDGWETRRRRDAGTHDWCIIRLGARGVVRGIVVDTTHFTGNFPESCAVDVAPHGVDMAPHGVDMAPGGVDMAPGGVDVAPGDLSTIAWHEILPRTPLRGDAPNLFTVDGAPAATHVRLRIFPDGGVARFRAHGTVLADWDRLKRRREVDLAAAEHGGLIVSCSDMFFGSGHNLIMPGDATHMGDGWETKRRRGPGHDWTVLQLAAAGTIHRIEVDTRHFKGNAPGACSLEAASPLDENPATDGSSKERLVTEPSPPWRELLPRTPLRPHGRHTFEIAPAPDPVTHVRFNIFPDGGVGRLRLWGLPR